MNYSASTKWPLMPEPRRSAAAKLAPADVEWVAAAVGRLVRAGRAKRGMTRRQLAHASGASERYLAQIEAGAGNPSVIVLAAVAEALDVPISDLLPRPKGRVPAMARILDLVARAPASDLSMIAELLEACTGDASSVGRAQRIALIGLRGAGKSTLGRELGDQLGFPFIELDPLVEQEYGAPIPDLIEMAGVATFRRYERACLDRVIAQQDAAVIATAGGIVANAETFGVLLRSTHTVWIKARPDEHMSRVVQQGDFRPMAKNREAMADLNAILEARAADYARAHAVLDTSGDPMERSCEKLLQIAKRLLASAPSHRPPPAAGEILGDHARGGPL